MAKYGSEVMLRGGISKEEIEETRRSIRIGDTVGYRMAFCVTTDKDIKYVEHRVDAVVVAKYPHLVEVVPVGDKRKLPIRTVTYTEIAMDQRKQEKKYSGTREGRRK